MKLSTLLVFASKGALFVPWLMLSPVQGLIETRHCIDPNTDGVQRQAAKTEGECSAPGTGCAGGCCRFHTAFLTCDEDDDFPHMPCVCNQNTAENNQGPPGGSPPGQSAPGGSPPGQSPPGGSPPGQSPPGPNPPRSGPPGPSIPTGGCPPSPPGSSPSPDEGSPRSPPSTTEPPASSPAPEVGLSSPIPCCCYGKGYYQGGKAGKGAGKAGGKAGSGKAGSGKAGGKGDMGKGVSGKGDMGKGVSGKGDMGKGVSGKGDMGKGVSGKGYGGKGYNGNSTDTGDDYEGEECICPSGFPGGKGGSGKAGKGGSGKAGKAGTSGKAGKGDTGKGMMGKGDAGKGMMGKGDGKGGMVAGTGVGGKGAVGKGAGKGTGKGYSSTTSSGDGGVWSGPVPEECEVLPEEEGQDGEDGDPREGGGGLIGGDGDEESSPPSGAPAGTIPPTKVGTSPTKQGKGGPPIPTCEFGSTWQTLGFPYQNCFGPTGCDGVTVNVNGVEKPTCCQKGFCWCDAFEDRVTECQAV